MGEIQRETENARTWPTPLLCCDDLCRQRWDSNSWLFFAHHISTISSTSPSSGASGGSHLGPHLLSRMVDTPNLSHQQQRTACNQHHPSFLPVLTLSPQPAKVLPVLLPLPLPAHTFISGLRCLLQEACLTHPLCGLLVPLPLPCG